MFLRRGPAPAAKRVGVGPGSVRRGDHPQPPRSACARLAAVTAETGAGVRVADVGVDVAGGPPGDVAHVLHKGGHGAGDDRQGAGCDGGRDDRDGSRKGDSERCHPDHRRRDDRRCRCCDSDEAEHEHHASQNEQGENALGTRERVSPRTSEGHDLPALLGPAEVAPLVGAEHQRAREEESAFLWPYRCEAPIACLLVIEKIAYAISAVNNTVYRALTH